MPEQGRVQTTHRDDSGAVMIQTLVGMAMNSLLLVPLLGTMWLGVQLIRTAPPSQNPTVYGVLVANAGRLEDSISLPLACGNPRTETTRTDCLKVVAAPLRPIPDPVHNDPAALADRQAIGYDATCWPVVHEEASLPDQRRLECWQLLKTGDLRSWVYGHNVPLSNTSDLLRITQWQISPDQELSSNVATGLTAVKWICPTTTDAQAKCSSSANVSTVELVTCASIKPGHRNLMKTGFVPFCDGTIGMQLSDGTDRPLGNTDGVCDDNEWLVPSGTPGVFENAAVDCEGYLLPPVFVYDGNR